MKRSFILGACQGAGILGVLLLGVLIAYATDILTVDKDGTVRLRVSNTGEIDINSSGSAPALLLSGSNTSMAAPDASSFKIGGWDTGSSTFNNRLVLDKNKTQIGTDTNGLNNVMALKGALYGYANKAAGKAVTNNGGILSGSGPTATIFGQDANNYWRADTAGDSFTIDLGANGYINIISFGTYWPTDLTTPPKDYTVAYSTDNVSFTTTVTVTGNTQVLPVHILGSLVNARYWRITVNAFQSGYSQSNICGVFLGSNTTWEVK